MTDYLKNASFGISKLNLTLKYSQEVNIKYDKY